MIAEFARVGEIGDTPAVSAILGHAFLGAIATSSAAETLKVTDGREVSA